MVRSSFALGLYLTLALTGLGGGQSQNKSSAYATASATNPFDSFKTFSATLNGGIGNDHNRRIHRLGDLMRLDFDDSYRVTDLRTNVTWGVHHDHCAKFAMPDAGTFPFSAYHDFKIERSLTTEAAIVDGHHCVIENVTFTPTDGRPFVVKMKLWEAQDLGRFPIKIVVQPEGPMGKAASKMELQYSNVSLSPPDAKLFQHPQECVPRPTSEAEPKTAPSQANKPVSKPPSQAHN